MSSIPCSSRIRITPIARASRTFGLAGYYVVTPITAAPKRPVNLDEPAIIRGGNKKLMPEALRELVMDEQLLDIPAFLRAQAD